MNEKLSPEKLENFQAKGKNIFCCYEKESEKIVNGIIVPKNDIDKIRIAYVISVGGEVEEDYYDCDEILFDIYRAREIFSNEKKVWIVIPEDAVLGVIEEN